MYDLSVYDEAFFSTNQWEGLRHAEWFMPLLVEIFNPKSLVDVGCGTGHFIRAAHEIGIEAYGLEGARAAIEHSMKPFAVMEWDLRETLGNRFKRSRYDLAISIEVAEHIEKEYAGVFVDTLCSLSDTIVMTAAPPGQGGLQHVNEQDWPYWRDLMRARGFVPSMIKESALLNGIMKAVADGHHVATWFRKNIMVFRRLDASS